MVLGTDDGSYTAGYAGGTTISYVGTHNAYPVFKIKSSSGAAAQLRSLRNWTTGAIIYLAYDMLDGETIEIDFRPGHEKINSSVYGNIPTLIRSNSDFGQFFLMSGNESGGYDNLITCFVQTAGGDPSLVVASLHWRNAYISED